MGRFASTVAYYESARPAYAPAFFAAAARELELRGDERLLDVGTGPGLLAIGFAPYCAEVVGLDPEPDMLAAARDAAQRAGVRLSLIEGRVEDAPETLDAFDVVTIGRALHWLDRTTALAKFERLVKPTGKILVGGARTVADARNPWLAAFNAVRARWSADNVSERYRDVVVKFFTGSKWRPDRAIRAESQVVVSVETLCDRVLSMSTSSPEKLGSEADVMRGAMRAALAPFAADGEIVETVEGVAQTFVRA